MDSGRQRVDAPELVTAAGDLVVPGDSVAGNRDAHFVRTLSRRFAPEQDTSPDGSAVEPVVRRLLRR